MTYAFCVDSSGGDLGLDERRVTGWDNKVVSSQCRVVRVISCEASPPMESDVYSPPIKH